MIGTTVGNYRILDLVSAGGMGTVYRAEHALLGRIAAVKVLHPEMCANKEIVNRFFNEAKATTAIKHPGIVEIFDFGYMPSGHAYLVMEFLEGMSLAHRMKLRGRVPEGEAAMVLRGVCSALAAAHAKGIVHRDLKPDNIFVIPDPDSALGERCKLLDFGIAKLTDIGMAGTATKTGAVMGTPTYMSPEQCKGLGQVDHRADLYSIGCILYELLTGVPPFQQLGAGELIGAHLFMQPESPQKYIPNLSGETVSLVMALLDKEPDRRVQTARDLAGYLTQIAQHQGWAIAAEPERISMQMMSAPGDMTRAYNPTPSPPVFTPVFAVHRTPGPLVPLMPTPSNNLVSVDQKPTTLSSATGQPVVTQVPAKRKRSPMMIAALIAVLAGGIVGAIAFVGTRGSDPAVSPAAQPAPPPAAVVASPPPPPAPVVVPPPPTPPPPTPAVVVVTPDPPPPPPEIKKAAVKAPVVKKATKAAVKATPTEQPKKDDGLLESDL